MGSDFLLRGLFLRWFAFCSEKFKTSDCRDYICIFVTCRNRVCTGKNESQKSRPIKQKGCFPKGKISNINVDVQKDGSVIVDENNNTRVFYDPIYILDGKKISKDKFKNLDADKIKSITVLKGEDAIKSYGKDGENGALIIQTKGNTATSTDPIKTITITKKDTSEDIMKNTFCIVDGKKISETELKNIDPNNIQSITVLKDEKSKEEYGATDKDCVIWITLKK